MSDIKYSPTTPETFDGKRMDRYTADDPSLFYFATKISPPTKRPGIWQRVLVFFRLRKKSIKPKWWDNDCTDAMKRFSAALDMWDRVERDGLVFYTTKKPVEIPPTIVFETPLSICIKEGIKTASMAGK